MWKAEKKKALCSCSAIFRLLPSSQTATLHTRTHSLLHSKAAALTGWLASRLWWARCISQGSQRPHRVRGKMKALQSCRGREHPNSRHWNLRTPAGHLRTTHGTGVVRFTHQMGITYNFPTLQLSQMSQMSKNVGLALKSHEPFQMHLRNMVKWSMHSRPTVRVSELSWLIGSRAPWALAVWYGSC